MNQTFMWGSVPAPEAVRGLERFADFLLRQDMGPATHAMVRAWFEPEGMVRQIAGASNNLWFRQLTGPGNQLRPLLEHVKPALIKMEDKGHGREVVEIREFLTRLGEWDSQPAAVVSHPDIERFISRGFPRLEDHKVPARKSLPRPPMGPPPRPPMFLASGAANTLRL